MPDRIGKYRIVERIGRGGMGMVFKAHDPDLDRHVALKVISSDGDATEELKARFYREARAGARLSHPNIIVVHDLGEDQGQLFIVMELLDGEELKRIIAERRSLSLEEKLPLMIQICRGLHYAHQSGVIHRDVKPGNIFVLRNGQVKILDFGIARIAATDPGLTRTGLIMGTLRYMSPEQARGRVDHRSDLFSAGAVFYELLAYRPAFDSDDPMETLERLRTEDPPPLTEVDPAIPAELAAIVARALRKDPAQRFADMGEFAARLEDVQRTLRDEAEALPARVRAQLEEIRTLESRVARQTGEPVDGETLPAVVEGARPADLRALERELAARITRLRARLEPRRPAPPPVPSPAPSASAAPPAPAVHARPAVTPRPTAPPAAAPRAPAPVTARPARGRRTALVAVAGLVLLALAGAGAYLLHPAPTPAPGPIVSLPTPQPAAAPAPAPGPTAPALAPTPPMTAAPPAAPAARPPAEDVSRQVLEAGRLQERAAAARRAAELADAAQHAAPAWGRAIEADRKAEEALKRRSFDEAQAGWREAEKAYRDAEGEASRKVSAAEAERVAARKRALQAAERVATAAGTARRDAEQAGAARLAARGFTAAEGTLREAEAALERQDYAAAQRGFREAQEEYQRAGQEAQRVATAEAATAAKQELERARTGSATARQQALAAGADRLAREAFEGARAKEAEAAALEGQPSLPAAMQAFQDASQRYAEALRRAQVAREAKAEADHARARMLAEKGRARTDTADFKSALGEESGGDQAYERLAFKEAVGRYQNAFRLFARASGNPSSGDAAREIRSVIDSYRQAIERKDVALLQQVRPSVREADIRKSFEQSESHKVDLTIRSVDVTGDEAEVRGRRADEVVSKDGKRLANEQAVVFKLRRTPAGWVIDTIN